MSLEFEKKGNQSYVFGLSYLVCSSQYWIILHVFAQQSFNIESRHII